MPREAAIEPMLPQPMTPSVLPVSSTPMKRFFSHLPACVDTSAVGICRASANMSAIACSAVVIELPNGVFMTITPRAVAAGMSTLSTPMPARPMTFSLVARSSSLAVTLVADRIARPSYPPMILASSSLSSPGLTSTSTPRSSKMATAAGESLSEMRTRGAMVKASELAASGPRMRERESGRRPALTRVESKPRSGRFGELALLESKGVVEPEGQRFDVGGFDRRAAPDAQAGRRIAIGADVEGDLLLLERAGERLGEGCLAIRGQVRDRRVDDPEADAGVRTGRGNASEEIDPRRALDPNGEGFGVSVRPSEQRLGAAERLRPLQRVEIVLNAEHRRRVDGLAFENSLDQFASLGKAEHLRQGPRRRVGLNTLGCARTQDDHAVGSLAAQNLLPGKGRDIELRPGDVLRKSGRSGVADRQALAIGGDPVGVGHAHA